MPALINKPDELVTFLKRFKGSSAGMGTLATVTDVIMRKTDNPYLGAVKVQTVEVKWNEDYEKRVNQQRVIERKPDDFVVEGLKWGVCKDNIVVEHGDQLYIKTIEVGRVGQPVFMFKGTQIPYSELAPYIPIKKPSPKQQLIDEVKVRTFKLDNIVSLIIGDELVYNRPVNE